MLKLIFCSFADFGKWRGSNFQNLHSMFGVHIPFCTRRLVSALIGHLSTDFHNVRVTLRFLVFWVDLLHFESGHRCVFDCWFSRWELFLHTILHYCFVSPKLRPDYMILMSTLTPCWMADCKLYCWAAEVISALPLRYSMQHFWCHVNVWYCQAGCDKLYMHVSISLSYFLCTGLVQ